MKNKKMSSFHQTIMSSLVVICSTAILSAETVSVSLSNHSPIAASGEIVDTGFFYAEPGEPNLPAWQTTILLPPHADLGTVTVTVSASTTEPIALTGEILPRVPMVTSTGKSLGYPNERSIVEGRNSSVYHANSLFPQSIVRTVRTGQLHDYKLVTVAVSRAVYNPVNRELRQITSADLTVHFTSSALRETAQPLYSVSNQTTIRDIAINYSDMKDSYPESRQSATRGYVIIAPSAIVKKSKELPRLVSLHKSEGFTVSVISEDSWGGGTGRVGANNIREWLKKNKATLAIEYVLILGNPSDSSLVPMVFGPHVPNENIPRIDYCYADLTGSLPASGANGFDEFAEVHVGRIPVYGGNTTDLDLILARTCRYITESKESAASWRKNIILPMGSFGDAQNGYVFGEYLLKNILNSANWKSCRIYDANVFGCDASPNSYATTVQKWNGGKFGMMMLQGHGMYFGCNLVLTSTGSAQKLTDLNPTHSFNISCFNALPDSATNLQFIQLKHQGITGVGYAQEVYYSTRTSSYGTGGGGHDYAYQYLKNMATGTMTAGESLDKSRSFMGKNDAGAWQNMVSSILYGDPAVGIGSSGLKETPISLLEQTKSSNSVVSAYSKKGTVSFAINGARGEIVMFTPSGRIIDRFNFGEQQQIDWNSDIHGISAGVVIAMIKGVGSDGTTFVKSQRLIVH